MRNEQKAGQEAAPGDEPSSENCDDSLMTSAKLKQIKSDVTASRNFVADMKQKHAAAVREKEEVAARRDTLLLDEDSLRGQIGAEDAAKLKCEVAGRALAQAEAILETAEAAEKRAEVLHLRDLLEVRTDFVMRRLRIEYSHHASAIAQIFMEALFLEEQLTTLFFQMERMGLKERLPPRALSVFGLNGFDKNHLTGLDDAAPIWPPHEIDKIDFTGIARGLPHL